MLSTSDIVGRSLKQAAAIVLMAALAVSLLTGCSHPPPTIADNNDPNIIGTWTGQMVDASGTAIPGVSATFNFHRDATVELIRSAPKTQDLTASGSFLADGQNITITYGVAAGSKANVFKGTYTIEGDILAIKGQSHYVLKRQY